MNVKLKLKINELLEKIDDKAYNIMRVILTPFGIIIDWVDKTNVKLYHKRRIKAEAMTFDEVANRMIKALVKDLIYEKKHSCNKVGEVKIVVASNSNTQYNPPTLQSYMRRRNDEKLRLFISKYKYSDVDFAIKYSRLIIHKLSAMGIENLTIDVFKEDYRLRYNKPSDYVETMVFKLK